MPSLADRFAETLAALEESDRKHQALIDEHLASVRALLADLKALDTEDVTVNNPDHRARSRSR